MGFSLFGSCAKKTPENHFWRWFEKNQEMLYNFENDRNQAFHKLKTALSKVHPDLTFEFGPDVNGVRDFVISAGGLREAFPVVKSLYESAPPMPRWNFIAFRPRRAPMPLKMNDITIEPSNLEIALEPDGVKPGFNVFVKDYEESKRDLYLHLVFLMLDQAIGEYDMTMKVGFIEIKSFEENTEFKRHRFDELPQIFDEFVTR